MTIKRTVLRFALASIAPSLGACAHSGAGGAAAASTTPAASTAPAAATAPAASTAPAAATPPAASTPPASTGGPEKVVVGDQPPAEHKVVLAEGYTVALVEMTLRAAGGDKLKTIKDVWAKTEMTATMGGETQIVGNTISVVPNKKMRIDMSSAGMDVKTVVTEEYGYVLQAADREVIPADELKPVLENALVSPQGVMIPGFVLVHAIDRKYELAALQPTMVDGKKMDLLEVTRDSGDDEKEEKEKKEPKEAEKSEKPHKKKAPGKMILFFDHKTHVMARIEDPSTVVSFSDYHTVAGIPVPYQIHVDVREQKGADGKVVQPGAAMDDKILDLKINQGIKDDVFKK